MASALAVSKLFDVAGKSVVITGGGRGIGRMLSEAFISNNAKTVFISSRKASALEQAASELRELGSTEVVVVAADLSTEEGCLELASEVGSKTDTLDVLINNSGTTWGEPFDTYQHKAWDRCFSLNVTAPFTLTRACRPLLEAAASPEDPARVINIGSIAGHQPQPVPTFAYDASKAAVHMLTRKLAAELAQSRITVNAIAPGFVPSSMSKQLTTYASAEAIASGIPMGRLGTTEDMAGAALFLASRAGAWCTGSVLTVDGGSVGASEIAFDMSNL